MPSDSNGNYALPSGYLAIGGDTILPSQHNPPLEDIASSLTGRLMRSGAGGMTGPFKAADGTAGAPSYTFGSALTHGFYKTSTGFGVAIGGTLVAEFGPGGLISGVQTISINDQAVALSKIVPPTAPARLLGSNANAGLTITGAANNGSGLIRLTVGSTSTFATGQKKLVAGVVGTTEANNRWTITVVDSTHIDLQGSVFTNAYVSGGTIGNGVDEIKLGGGLSFSGDTISSTIDPAQIPRFLTGLELSVAPASSTVTIGTGGANDVGSGGLMALTSALAKNTASWSVGNNQGALDSGAVAINTWYYVFLIKRTDTGVVDALLSTSVSAPTMPTNYTLKRLIGAVITDASSNFRRFYQNGDEFVWDQVTAEASTSGATPNGLYGVGTPPGLIVVAHMHMNMRSTNVASTVTVYSGLATTQTTGSGNISCSTLVANLDHYSQVSAVTNSSRQVQVVSNGVGSITWLLATIGWTWTRGK